MVKVMNVDLAVGIVVGLIQGALLHPLTVLFYRVATRLLCKVSKNPTFLIILGGWFAAFGLGCFLVLVIALKPLISVWVNFVSGLAIGFFVGAIAYTISCRKKN